MNIPNYKQPPQGARQNQQFPTSDKPLTLSFTAIDSSMLSLVGGKALHLGELVYAGLPVPEGFCVTTAAYELVSRDVAPLLAELATTGAGNFVQLERQAVALREALLTATVPDTILAALRKAYYLLTNGEPIPVAVRSSATAEDLPSASFAGQQETYLNVVGEDALIEALRRCWASLWTDRAVSYRASNGIDPRTVRLAVVIQRMVDAQVAGVLFTANPLTGKRRQAVIDANPGLGEAVVSGATNPDHFVINIPTGKIVECRLGDKRVLIQASADGGTQRIERAEASDTACLSDAQVHKLAELGVQVEVMAGAPQDIEWAIDASDTIWLLQTRPITTLFPLPADAPSNDKDLRVYFSVNVAQGVYRPLTPMGIAAFRMIASSGATLLGFPPKNPLAGPSFVTEAAQRLFFDMTSMVRTPRIQAFLMSVMRQMEARTGVIIEQLIFDPRLAPLPVSRWRVSLRLLGVFTRVYMAPVYTMQALLSPKAARKRLFHHFDALYALSEVPTETSASERLAVFERIFLTAMGSLLSDVMIPVISLIFGLPNVARKLLGNLATDDELQTVLRSIPYNPTTEMDLELWKLAQYLREDASIVALFQERQREELAQEYHTGSLPPRLQQGLADFLRLYGHRCIAEIDLGLPRWSDDPTYLFDVLHNYLQLTNPEMAPDVQFQRGIRDANTMVVELTRRAWKRNWLRGILVGFCLRRIRDLTGLREVPKFNIVRLLAKVRLLLLPVGEELVRIGRLESASDIFFMNSVEAREALAAKDFREIIYERRSNYEFELGRRHIPRILLSDGTDPEGATHAGGVTEGTLRGTPASAGSVSGKARVILNPVGARLVPGEILVAPSTDPGWTPLFLTAGGLVMEMGGSMSHGAIVAREYGIPAVVGVPGATERIATAQQITVDGSNGTIIIDSAEG